MHKSEAQLLNKCVVCYEINNYKTNCNHYVCTDCTDKMIINKELCPYCRQTRDDICSRCNDRNVICVCCVKYLFIDEFRQQFFKIIEENSRDIIREISDDEYINNVNHDLYDNDIMLNIIDFGCTLFNGEDEENYLFIQF